MFVNDEMLELIKSDPYKGIWQLKKKVDVFINVNNEWGQREYDTLLEAYALIYELEEAGYITPNYKILELTGEFSQDVSLMYETIDEVSKECKIEIDRGSLNRLRNRFRTDLGKGFSYEFSQGDLERVQELVNQLREHITRAELDGGHKQRLLARLEALQGELHKKVSDLDRFWGLIGDAGVVLAKLGDDAKPIVDRIKEVAGIVWKTQARSEELPSGAEIPLLGEIKD